MFDIEMETYAPLETDLEFSPLEGHIVDAFVDSLDRTEITADLLPFLATIDPAVLSPERRATLAAAWTRTSSWVAARQQKSLAALVGPWQPDAPMLDRDPMVAEVGAMLGLAPRTAANRVALVRELQRLPRTMALLEAGRIHWMQAVKVADVTMSLSDEAAAYVDTHIAERLERLSIGRTGRVAQRLALAADPDRAKKESEQVRAEPDVTAGSIGEGCAELVMTGPTADVAGVMSVVERTASVIRRLHPDLTAGQARFAALQHLVHRGADRLDACPACGAVADRLARSSRRRRARTQVVVAVPHDVLTGASDAPAEVVGYGPITADEARRAAWSENTEFRRLVYDPATGTATDLGRTTYQIPDDLADLVHARDAECTGPSCGHVASDGEVDHRLAWGEGGTTSLSNLGSACPSWHDRHTHDGWRVETIENGGARWISPLGRHYDRNPYDYRPPPKPEPVPVAPSDDDIPPF